MKVTPKASASRHAPEQVDAQYRDNPNWKRLVDRIKALILYYTPDPTESEVANFNDTPIRAAKAWIEFYGLDPSLSPEEFNESLKEFIDPYIENMRPKATTLENVRGILETGFPLESRSHDGGIITQGPVNVDGVCPHHMLPVHYEVFVSYQPAQDGMVLGLSKLARLATELCSRPVLQEQATADIADALYWTQPISASKRVADDPETNEPRYVHTTHESPMPQIESGGSAVQLIGHHMCMCGRGVTSDALTLTTALRGAYYTMPELKNEFYQAIMSIRNSDLGGSVPEDEEDFELADEDGPFDEMGDD